MEFLYKPTICMLSSSLFFFCSTKWVEINGTIYKKSCVLVIGSEDEFPVFARVTNIYVSQGKVVFFVLELRTNL